MLNVGMATPFQDIAKTNKICINIRFWMIDAMTYAGLGSKIHDMRKIMIVEKLFHVGTIG